MRVDSLPFEIAVRAWHGEHGDQFIQLTEGLVADETLEPAEAPHTVEIERPEPHRTVVTVTADVYRVGIVLPGGRRFTGLGARHGLQANQAGRSLQLGADRRYTGPDCPPDMLELGGIPQGDYAPVPWLLGEDWAAWVETDGPGARFDLGDEVVLSVRVASGPLRVHLFTHATPAARLRAFLRLTGFPAVLPEWGYGFWKSRDIHEHQRDVDDDFDGFAEHRLPLDAIVIDSPWATQYNTWEFNPHQFPDARGMIARMRAAGVKTVVWVAPWVNLDSSDGQRPPDAESERLHKAPAPNYEPGREHYVRQGGEPFVAKWWMGVGSPVDFTSPAAEAWWREQAKRVLELGVQGIKADDGEGWYLPDDVEFSDGRNGAQAAWAHGLRYRRSMQRALDEVHPGEGVLFGRPGWTGQQAVGVTWGGDQPSDFYSLRTLVAATLTAAASGFSNWSHDIGGYLGERLVSRCPKELLLRWVQFGCFTPLMHAHGRFEQEPWTYDEQVLDVYRDYILLHERLVPYTRAAAATAARTGLPIIRPLPLTAGTGWGIADAYGYGPSLWVAPVLEADAREREVTLPDGDWIDFWTGRQIAGGGTVLASAPLHRIPVWVRNGALIVTYAADAVAEGLRGVQQLEATLWGDPPCGRAAARLAGGERVRYAHGEWSADVPITTYRR